MAEFCHPEFGCDCIAFTEDELDYIASAVNLLDMEYDAAPDGLREKLDVDGRIDRNIERALAELKERHVPLNRVAPDDRGYFPMDVKDTAPNTHFYIDKVRAAR